MRRILLFAIILFIVGGGWFILRGADGMAQRAVLTQLKEAGFSYAEIGRISAGPRKTAALDITLDRQRIDTIQSISLERGWLSFFKESDDADITIDSPDIYRHITHAAGLLPVMTGLSREALADLPKGRLTIRNGRLNIASPPGDFQFLYNLMIDPPGNDGRRLINATIKSNQPTLDFESEWRGWIEADGTLMIDTLIPEIKAAIGILRLTRGNGWLSVSNAGKYPTLSGQIESGAASLSEFPLQNFALTLDIAHQSINVLARAKASGAPQTILSADVTLNDVQQDILLSLSSTNPESFFDYLDDTLERPAAGLKKSFSCQSPLFLAVIYQPTKRFAGGPHPFDMRGAVQEKEFMSGTFLVYPDTFDMRGSARVESAYLPGIISYFKIPQETISGDYIRLDASLAALFSGVGTGIVDNTGEGP